MITCTKCGARNEAIPGNPPPDPDQCRNCPPERCNQCGGINHVATDRMCDCWVSLESLPLADIKGLLAISGLSVETPKFKER